MRRILMVASVLTTACGGATPRTTPIPRDQVGTYNFTERLGADAPKGSQTMVLDGTVTITADSVILDMSPGPCSYDNRSISSTNISYRCADVMVGFDRSNPLLRAWYSAMMLETVPVRVCVRFVTNASGQQTCAQYGTEYNERRVTRSGRLRLTRAQ